MFREVGQETDYSYKPIQLFLHNFCLIICGLINDALSAIEW
jgi:hypothetical protein